MWFRLLMLLHAFGIFLFFENFRLVQEPRARLKEPNPKNLLALYGEKVFAREGCLSCHTLHIEEASQQKISLDGVGGKYSPLWMYYYLQDARQVIPESLKPAFAHLHVTPIDPALLFRIQQEKGWLESQDSLWVQLNQQADALAEVIYQQGGDKPMHTEILALIEYIEQIPPSPERQRRDSLEYLQFLDENEGWEEFIRESEGLVQEFEKDSTQVGLGKALFEMNCSPCHGNEAQGIIGPNLTDAYWLHGAKVPDLARTILYGVPQKGMISWKSVLKPSEVGAIITFLRSIRGSRPEGAKAPQGIKE